MRAVVRWIFADLRAHRGQATLVATVISVVVMSLVLASALLRDAANPWQRTFEQSNGAHVWLHVRPGVDTSAVSHLDDVKAVAGPYRAAPVTLVRSTGKVSLELWGIGPEPPQVARPVMRSGHWLDAAVPDGIVLESSLARSVWAGTGDHVTVRSVDGVSHTVQVVGVADSADQGAYPNWTPGLGWVLPGTLNAIEPDTSHTEQALGLRLSDPLAADFTTQRAVTALGGDQVTQVSTWNQVRASMDQDNRLLGLLLGMFGLVALMAAALAVAGAAGSRVLGQLRDIATLKAVGFTPGQIVRMFLYEHTALALAGITLGTVAATVLGPLMPGRIGEAMTVWQTLPGHVAVLALTGAGAVLCIALATVLPAWRAGRVPPTPAMRSDVAGHGMSRPARLALLLHMPPALVLGARDAFHRPLRATLTVTRLAIPILMITVALGSWATLDGFRRHPERVGIVGSLTARPSGIDDAEARSLLGRTPGVAAVYPGVELEALVPGQTGTVTVRGIGTSEQPYPYPITEGRGIREKDEAVAGQGLLDLMHVHVGSWVRVTAGGTPYILHIVGRAIQPDHSGDVLSVGLDALDGPGGPPRPQYYSLVPRDGTSPNALRASVQAAAPGRLDVRPVNNPADQLGVLRAVIVGLVAVLGLIGLAELLTATGGELRDHTRDLGVLRAIGLTPRQVAGMIVTSTTLLTLTATVTGTALGLLLSDRLINLQGRSSGVGTGIAAAPTPTALLLLVTAAVAVAALVSAVPAARATRTPVTAAFTTA